MAAGFHHDDFELSVAEPAEYGEVELLSRSADRREVFMPLTSRLLAWFLDENPAGPGFLVLARSRQDGSLAGHFMFYANTLVVSSESGEAEIPAYLYVDLYVIPGFRRRGVFGAMFAFGLDVLGRMGVPFAYTVPNPRSGRGFAKFGVPLLGHLPVRMAPAWRGWRALTRLVSPAITGVEVERVGAFDERMLSAAGGPFAPPRGEALVRGLRTLERLDWRFMRRPDTEYGIWRVLRHGAEAGYLVTRVLKIQAYRVLAVCDVALRPFDAGHVATVLRGVLRQTGEVVDLVMLQGGPPATRGLWRAGLPRVPERFLPQPVAVYGGAPGERRSTGGLPLLHRWQLTPCDWDVF